MDAQGGFPDRSPCSGLLARDSKGAQGDALRTEATDVENCCLCARLFVSGAILFDVNS